MGVLGALLNKAVVVVVVVQVVVFFSSTIIFLSRIFLLLGESIGIIDNGLFLLALLVVKIMIGGRCIVSTFKRIGVEEMRYLQHKCYFGGGEIINVTSVVEK